MTLTTEGRRSGTPRTLQPASSRPRHAVRARRLRSVLVITLFLAAGTAVGAVGSLLVPDVTVASVRVVVTPLPGNAFSERSSRAYLDLNTEAQLIRSDEVLAEIEKTQGEAWPPDVVRPRLRAENVARTEILVISFQGKDPDQAAIMARAAAEAALEVRQVRARTALQDQADLLGELLTKAERDLALAASAEGVTGSVPTLSRRVTDLRDAYSAVAGARPTGGSIIAESSSGDPRTGQKQIALLAAGALVGAGWGVVRARRRSSGSRQ